MLEVNPASTLLDILRNDLRLTGTKEGCREGDCGACTILVGTPGNAEITYRTMNSCLLPIGDIHGKHVVTVEGLKESGLNLVQAAMVDEGGTQCGFCTPGFIMSMTGYFINEQNPTLDSAIAALDGNICRCTGYAGIKRAFAEALIHFEKSGTKNHFEKLMQADIIPDYFQEIPARLAALPLPELKAANGQQPVPVGGGTDLFVQRWDSIADSAIDLLNTRPAPRDITIVDSCIVIPATTTISSVIQSPIIRESFPKLESSLLLFGSLPIRNRATVAGNIVNASPIADFVNILLAVGAEVRLSENGKITRTLPLHELYIGYKNLDKKPTELIQEIVIPLPGKEFLMNYEKVSKRTHLDIASVNSTCYLEHSNGIITLARISAGGVGPIPIFLKKASAYLAGKEFTIEVLRETIAIALTEISPMSDARGTARYKTLLLSQLIKAHFLTLFPNLLAVEEVL